MGVQKTNVNRKHAFFKCSLSYNGSICGTISLIILKFLMMSVILNELLRILYLQVFEFIIVVL